MDGITRHEAAKAKVLGMQPAIDCNNEAFAKNSEDEKSAKANLLQKLRRTQ